MSRAHPAGMTPWGLPAAHSGGQPLLDDPKVSMNPTTYQIRLRGPLPAEVASALGRSARVVDVPPQTVLRTTPLDPAAVHALIRRLSDFGIELLELRRCVDRPGARREQP